MEYIEFLKNKKKLKTSIGIDVDIHMMNDVLFPFQKACVQRALQVGRFALFEACGLGKTLQQLEWAHHVVMNTGGNVLILAPLGVTVQTRDDEAPLLRYEVTLCRSQEDVRSGINITNYEMLDKFNTDEFIGVVLDESSILKNFTGATRLKLTNAFANTKYKLCCTATPAPNDLMELLNHADFLGVMSTAKALATYFINDMKTGEWRLKGHATKEFYRWCCTWSVNVDSPSDLGFDGSSYALPKLNERVEVLEVDQIDEDFKDGFFREVKTSATGFNEEKRNTAEARARKCAEFVQLYQSEQFIIWCDLNDEADLLMKLIPEAVEVRGSDKPSVKEQAAQDFKHEKIRVLISKPKIFGYGMNFQKCHNVLFCGLTYSYENYYQALRRIYRFGQSQEVNCWVILGSTELHIMDTINRKRKQQEELKNQMDMSLKEIQMLSIEASEEVKETGIPIPCLPSFI
ncbi:MAG: DEAD/DEAH box helicase [Anaerorhabdus sp.]|uniref:DEAD/DEAH box helicase n=1 Tax=Anaerorhabdus sp. TaxID=1872524 RepID=UPI002FCB3C18